MPDPQQTATFQFSTDDGYRLLPVNCVWGGRTPRGDIMVHLCHENFSLPKAVTHVLANNALGEELHRDQDSALTRLALAGMVLTAEQAYSIGQWLMEKGIEGGFRPEAAKNAGASNGTTH